MASTRIRPAGTQDIVAVARMADGSFVQARQEVQGHHRRLRRLNQERQGTDRWAENVTPSRPRPARCPSAGEVITIKTLISHPMESGQRRDGDGNQIPRSIINRFTLRDFNGENVLDATFEPAISTNPFLEFQATVPDIRHLRLHLV